MIKSASFRLLGGVLLLMAAATPAAAQTSPCGPSPAAAVPNPTLICFEPSPDHDRVLEGGQPAVTEYALEVYLVGGPTPIYTTSLGKPAPAGGAIRTGMPLIPVMEWFLPHEGRIVAMGPTGTGRSELSNRFFIGVPRAVRGVVFLPQ